MGETSERADAVILLGAGASLSLDALDALARGAATGALHPDAPARMAGACALLHASLDAGHAIYGVNTGYGPLASYHIGADQAESLQRHLIAHLASGVGPPLSRRATRATMAARAHALAHGYSAARPQTVEALVRCLNADLWPRVPSLGTVGASGDLTPLAHMARLLLGDGAATLRGRAISAQEGLAAIGLSPLTLTYKEGLALVNGTSVTAAQAALNATDAERAWWLSARLGALYAEVMGAHAQAYDPCFGQVRAHPGQQRAHEVLGALLQGSGRLKRDVTPQGAGDTSVSAPQALLQDPYSLRCAPQLLGATRDVIDFHAQLTQRELDAVTDNPIFDVATGRVLHGGNFFGQHLALASDALAPALVTLANWAERRVARVTDVSLSQGLPPFLQARQPGLQSGLMGAQVSATALTAHMRAHASPQSIHTLPTNANNQDIVPLGTLAAQRVAQLLERLWEVLAIDAIALTQAAELRQLTAPAPLSPHARLLMREVRALVAPLDDDRALSDDIQRLAASLSDARWAPLPTEN